MESLTCHGLKLFFFILGEFVLFFLVLIVTMFFNCNCLLFVRCVAVASCSLEKEICDLKGTFLVKECLNKYISKSVRICPIQLSSWLIDNHVCRLSCNHSSMWRVEKIKQKLEKSWEKISGQSVIIRRGGVMTHDSEWCYFHLLCFCFYWVYQVEGNIVRWIFVAWY